MLDAGPLFGQVVPLDVMANAASVGRVKSEKGVVRWRGQELFVGQKAAAAAGLGPAVPPPGAALPGASPAVSGAPVYAQLPQAAGNSQPSYSPQGGAAQLPYSSAGRCRPAASLSASRQLWGKLSAGMGALRRADRAEA